MLENDGVKKHIPESNKQNYTVYIFVHPQILAISQKRLADQGIDFIPFWEESDSY